MWREADLEAGHRPLIWYICEFKYNTGEWFEYLHCAFLIVLNSFCAYVFDPTGVQFGPDWPLLSSYDEYKAKRFAKHEVQEIERNFRPLGRNLAWWDGGCIGRF